MSVLKLKPAFKDYIWGGDRLKRDFGKVFDGDILAESWELSAHPDGPSVVQGGEFEGLTFPDYLKTKGREVLGLNCDQFEDFPVLIKFIDAKKNLSVQVHPSDVFALEHEHQYGKTECWYILDAAPGAGLYLGLKEKLSKEEFESRIRDNTLLEALYFQPVKPGEMYFIKSGTLHAIGEGVLLAEIQQNSNVTYRVYDFGRVGTDGKPRPLHIDKAIAVSDLSGVRPVYDFGEHLADCRYFTVDDLPFAGDAFLNADSASFLSLLITEGSGELKTQKEIVSFRKGDSLFIEAGTGELVLSGTGHALLTYISGKPSD